MRPSSPLQHEMRGTVCWLASDASSYVTGTDILVNAGKLSAETPLAISLRHRHVDSRRVQVNTPGKGPISRTCSRALARALKNCRGTQRSDLWTHAPTLLASTWAMGTPSGRQNFNLAHRSAKPSLLVSLICLSIGTSKLECAALVGLFSINQNVHSPALAARCLTFPHCPCLTTRPLAVSRVCLLSSS